MCLAERSNAGFFYHLCDSYLYVYTCTRWHVWQEKRRGKAGMRTPKFRGSQPLRTFSCSLLRTSTSLRLHGERRRRKMLRFPQMVALRPTFGSPNPQVRNSCSKLIRGWRRERGGGFGASRLVLFLPSFLPSFPSLQNPEGPFPHRRRKKYNENWKGGRRGGGRRGE